MAKASVDKLLQTAEAARSEVGATLHDRVSEAIYSEASRIADRAVERPDQPRRFNLDRNIDNIVTSPIWGFPLMFLLLMGVFWLTIAGANVPSAMLATLTTEIIYEALHNGAAAIAMPVWLSGLLIDGVYLAAPGSLV
jgi:ferrous iron transport protein B